MSGAETSGEAEKSGNAFADVEFPEKELDILSQAQFVVTFGQVDYKVTQLKFKASRAWRKDLSEFARTNIGKLRGSVMTSLDARAYADGFSSLFSDIPDELFELLKSYDPSLPWDRIEEEAYPMQIELAFQKTLDIAFPFGGSVARSLGIAMNNGLRTAR